MELIFKSDVRARKWRFIAKSFSHPSKMILPLQLWLIDHFSKPGDIIVDCMAGSGTVLVACALGRHVIAIDLEEKFCDMMKGNWEKIQQQGPELGCEMGKAIILQGDARNLAEIVQGIDVAVFSPPYGNPRDTSEEYDDKYDLRRPKGVAWGRESFRGRYGESEGQIGNLPYGEVDLALFSPPYGIPATGTGESQVKFEERLKRISQSGSKWHRPRPTGCYGVKDYGTTEGQIGSLPYGKVDCIGFSPPYEGSLTSSSQHGNTGIAADNPKLADTGRYKAENNDNVGNLKGENYLTEMLKIYQGCYTILKPNGWLVLVVKNFIREHKEIRLDLDTIALCENAGFHLEETHYRRLNSQSFWRTIALQRCDHRRGSKQDPRCKLGLTCPVKEEQQLSLERKPKTSQEMVEKLCSEYVNSSPEIDREQILAFRKDKNCR